MQYHITVPLGEGSGTFWFIPVKTSNQAGYLYIVADVHYGIS